MTGLAATGANPAPVATTTRSAADIEAWLRLTGARGLGTGALRRLLATFGLPHQLLAQTVSALAAVIPEKHARALLAPPDAVTMALVERTVAWAAEPGNHVVTLADAAYPRPLLDLSDPPLVLYVKGRLGALGGPAIAMVGARSATVQGTEDARRFARVLSGAGLAVVSGLALGIDGAAHEGALEGALEGAGGTVAVIGTGADLVYPARHRDLAHRIAAHGAIVSEFALGMPGRSHHFPQRNRIIAALARGVLVVEAAARSGSLITARLAAEMGREVYAIPGSIHAPLSKGCHLLIRQGAKLVETAQDVLEELGMAGDAARPVAPAPMPALDDVLGLTLTHDPVTLDALCARTALPPEQVVASLLTLELAGAVERLPGNVYRRVS
ncbi:DNA-processing protein DprA [Cupriavidus basilensis]|uniref:DNA-processing protein DprA n=1 Tax=Cupriavidus basilensis TaxID=68895 RepID=UPI00157B282C|nr:DNA-processing protein DprA [Cupriavidus basilensis]NUA27360.1 DNA-protecting protein DprA [Cupriavidus basilensis]